MTSDTHILVVDDEPKICQFLGILLGREGYDVDFAYNANEALDRIEAHPYDLVLTDLKMPGMDGFELIAKVKALKPELPIIMITGYATVATAVQALRHGVEDYLTKPFNIDELRKVISRALQSATIERERRALAEQARNASAEMIGYRKLVEDQCLSVIRSLVAKSEARDHYTIGHSQRVAESACALAKEAGVAPEEIEVLHKAADLHDIGQVLISEEILGKHGALSARERGLVNGHPAEGARMIEPLDFLNSARPLIRSHHERIDGRGYPDGLHGERIPVLARILTIADAFDAMTSERPYRPAMKRTDAIKELESCAGRQFDEKLAHTFCANVVSGV